MSGRMADGIGFSNAGVVLISGTYHFKPLRTGLAPAGLCVFPGSRDDRNRYSALIDSSAGSDGRARGLHHGMHVYIPPVLFVSCPIFPTTEDPLGEGGDFSTSVCEHGFNETNGACLVNDCTFNFSYAGKKGGSFQLSRGAQGSRVDVHRSFWYNITCGEVSLRSDSSEIVPGEKAMASAFHVGFARSATFAGAVWCFYGHSLGSPRVSTGWDRCGLHADKGD